MIYYYYSEYEKPYFDGHVRRFTPTVLNVL